VSRMKKRIWLVSLFLLLLLAACGAPAAETTAPAPPTTEEEPTEKDAIEGIIIPARQSSMSFLLGGNISEIFVAEGDAVEEGQPLIRLSTPELDSQLRVAETALDVAEADLQYWRIHRGRKPPERKWLAEDRVDAAKASVETALASQSQQILLAPYAATVIILNVAPEEVVDAYEPVLLLADLKNLRVETINLSERDVVNIQPGQGALIYVEALDAEYHGKVSAISPFAGDNNGDITYTLTIELDEIPDTLRWGMSTTIDFESD